MLSYLVAGRDSVLSSGFIFLLVKNRPGGAFCFSDVSCLAILSNYWNNIVYHKNDHGRNDRQITQAASKQASKERVTPSKQAGQMQTRTAEQTRNNDRQPEKRQTKHCICMVELHASHAVRLLS